MISVRRNTNIKRGQEKVKREYTKTKRIQDYVSNVNWWTKLNKKLKVQKDGRLEKK